MLNEITAFSSKITICSTSNDNSKKISSILFNYFFDEKMTKSAEKKVKRIPMHTIADDPLKNSTTTTTSTMNEIDEIEKKRQRTHIRKR